MRCDHTNWTVYDCRAGLPPKEVWRAVYEVDKDFSPVPIREERRAGTVKGDHVHALPYWSERRVLTFDDKPSKVNFAWSSSGRMPVPPGGFCVPGNIGDQVVAERKYEIWPLNYIKIPEDKLPEFSPAELEFLRGTADTKALAQLNKALVNLPMLFKERRETLQMAAGKVGSILDVARDVQQRSLDRWRKAAKKDRRRVARDIANEHLELIFGWFPLIGEVEGAMEFIAQERFEFIKGRGTQAIRKNRSVHLEKALGDHDPTLGRWLLPGKCEMRGQITDVLSVRTSLRMDITSAFAGDARALGFEPVATLYDMVPLSFISGWVSNFDKYVRTIAPLVGLEFKTGSRSQRRSSITDLRARFVENPTLEASIVTSWNTKRDRNETAITGQHVRDDRFVLSELPSASLHWDFDVGWYEVAAGVSLAVQRKLKPLQRLLGAKSFRYRGSKPRDLPPIRYTQRP